MAQTENHLAALAADEERKRRRVRRALHIAIDMVLDAVFDAAPRARVASVDDLPLPGSVTEERADEIRRGIEIKMRRAGVP